MSSSLSKAPLIEVSLRLWWHLVKSKDFRESFYIVGDFNRTNSNYLIRENKGPSEEGEYPFFITTQFKESQDDQYEVLLSNTFLSFISTDPNYNWVNFENKARNVCHQLIAVLDGLLKLDHLHVSLNYIDFIPFEQNTNRLAVMAFLRDYLNLSVDFSLLEDVVEFGNILFSFQYKTDFGTVIVEIRNGEHDDVKGIAMSTSVESKKMPSDTNAIVEWSQTAHQECRKVFKTITQGPLFESFK